MYIDICTNEHIELIFHKNNDLESSFKQIVYFPDKLLSRVPAVQWGESRSRRHLPTFCRMARRPSYPAAIDFEGFYHFNFPGEHVSDKQASSSSSSLWLHSSSIGSLVQSYFSLYDKAQKLAWWRHRLFLQTAAVSFSPNASFDGFLLLFPSVCIGINR